MAGGGPPIFVLHGDSLDSGEAGLTQIAFSPDGRLLASAGTGSVLLWDLSTGKVAAVLGHRSAVLALAFHPTQALLATAGGPAESTVRLWNTRTGQPAEGLDSNNAYIYSLAFSPDGTELAAAIPQDGVLVWGLADREGPTHPAMAPLGANIVAYHPNGSLFAAGDDGVVHERNGMAVSTHDSAIRAFVFGARKSIAFGGESGRIDVLSEAGHHQLDAHAGPVLSIALSPDGDLLASAHDDGHVRIWHTGTGALLEEQLAHRQDGQAKSVAFSPNGDLLAAGCGDGTIRLWRVAPRSTPSFRRFSAHDGAVTSLAFSGDGSMLLSGGVDGVVRTWDAGTLEPAAPETSTPGSGPETPRVRSVVSGGDITAAMWSDSRVLWWQTAALGDRRMAEHPQVGSVALTPDGQRLVVGVADGGIRLWKTWPPRLDPEVGPQDISSGLVFSPDGSLLFGIDADGMARLVRLDPWQTVWEFEERKNVASCAAFSDDGSILLLGERGGSVTTWDLRRLEQVDFTLGESEQYAVVAMAYGAYDRSLAVLLSNAQLLLYSVDRVGKLQLLEREITHELATAVAYSPDGTRLAIGYRDGRIDLGSLVGDAPAPEAKAPPEVVVTMDADVASWVDRLGVRREARGLARVLTARDTGTPFALALLGDWGSGKSTFMNLLWTEIDELSGQAARHVVGRRDLDASPYCAGVRQVAFNAWHYADDHLWAGLIRHLLGQLAGHPTVDAAGQELTQRERDDLETQITEARLDLAAVEADLLADEEPPRVLRWLFGSGTEAHTFEAAQRGARNVRQRLRAVGWVAVLVAAVGLGGLAILIATDTLGSWAAATCTILGAIGAATGVLHRWMVTSLDRWRGQLREIAEAATLPGHEAQLARRAALTARLERLEADLAATDPERRLTRFLHDRRDSADYAAYRGLLSLVHDDLAEMTDLIDQHVTAWPPMSTQLTPPLQRVVLYIDDLDRCEPKRVVEVLAAIHLILAMPLFVVVVAVDPRWLLRCLRHHYVELLDTEDDDAKLGVHASTPIAYLEKIFQVAYQLPHMDAGLSELVDTLMPLRPSPGGEEEAETGEDTTPDEPLITLEDAIASTATDGTLAARAEVAAPIPLPPPRPRRRSWRQLRRDATMVENELAATQRAMHELELTNQTINVFIDGKRVKQPGDDPEVDAVDTRPLDFSAEERAMVTALGPILQTPRTLKRLVNVYRVVRATVAEADEQRLADEYGYVLLLLAVALGQPLAAPWLFGVGADSRKDDLIAALEAAGPPTPSADTLPGPSKDAVGQLRRDVGKVVADSPSPIDDIATYRYWLPVVGRYSFRRPALREVGGEELLGDEALEAVGVAVDPGAAEP